MKASAVARVMLAVAVLLAGTAKAAEFVGFILLDNHVQEDKAHADAKSARAQQKEMMMVCKQEKKSDDMQCRVRTVTILRRNHKDLADAALLDGNGRLTEAGLAAYRDLKQGACARLSMPTSSPVPAFEAQVARLLAQIERLKQQCRSEEVFRRDLEASLKAEDETCLILAPSITEERVFQPVGAKKWIQSVRRGSVATLSVGPIFADGTGRGWTLEEEGTDGPEGKDWKETWRGVEVEPQMTFVLDYPSCKRFEVN